ncbi:MAG TPA: hypothetical protein VN756_06110 [Solirubrobacterales bacterium]|nr:hypothetical protein [Solirubrobacterales bacterium]
MLLAVFKHPLIGLLAELAQSAAETFVVMATAGGVCFRSWAILARKPEDRLNWWSAVGAGVGVGAMILFVLVDWFAEGG